MKPVRILICVALALLVAGCAKETPSPAPATPATETSSTPAATETSAVPAPTATTGTEEAPAGTATAPAESKAASPAQTEPAAGTTSEAPSAATESAEAPVATPPPPTQAPAVPPLPVATAPPPQPVSAESPEQREAAAALIAKGKSIFGAKCASCHGADGSNETAIGRSRKVPPFGSPAVQNLTDSELTRIIHEGKGSVSARAHKSKALTDEEVHAVIAFIRSLH